MNSLFIITEKGEIIIEKHWTTRISRGVGEKFWNEVEKCERFSDVLPIIQMGNFYLIHVYRHEMFFVGVVQSDIPPMMVIDFLSRMVDVFRAYCKRVTEETIKTNFVTIYQLLDEMVDYGFPTSTELSVLAELVRPPEGMTVHSKTGISQLSVGEQMTQVEWRKPGIRYSQNEVFFDIIEDYNVVIDVNGMAVSSEIIGKISCNCKLSGMPDLMLQFKDSSLIEDCSFHPCVRLARYEQDKCVTFIPPDGQFDLMNYRISNVPVLPIYCRPQVSFNGTVCNVQVMTNTKSQEGNQLEEVKIIIPLPKNALSASKVTANVGTVHFSSSTKELLWDLGKYGDAQGKTPVLSGQVQLENNIAPETTPSVLVKFKLNSIAYSGLKVDQVIVKQEQYKPYKGVRYVTLGKLQVRTC